MELYSNELKAAYIILEQCEEIEQAVAEAGADGYISFDLKLSDGNGETIGTIVKENSAWKFKYPSVPDPEFDGDLRE
jgi:hypothetical protein